MLWVFKDKKFIILQKITLRAFSCTVKHANQPTVANTYKIDFNKENLLLSQQKKNKLQSFGCKAQIQTEHIWHYNAEHLLRICKAICHNDCPAKLCFFFFFFFVKFFCIFAKTDKWQIFKTNKVATGFDLFCSCRVSQSIPAGWALRHDHY